ncbi:MAG TPA: DedA family protein, partial [Aestuariivirga sp.]|nr:DedA family protein [Aestuariivirga sp.]
MDYLQPYLDFFTAHPSWALAVIFLIAFGEALLVIGLFVPSTTVLVGAGMLVGTGHLGLWPVMIATALGAILGDQVSYWAGRLYGPQLKQKWPLTLYPALVEKSEAFVREHGGKSIAIGRFVPGVKAIVPGIVGMVGMKEGTFLAVNIISGIVWTALHILPGVMIGKGLAMAGEVSGRLMVVLLALLVVLALAGWFTRLAAAWITPHTDQL